MKAKIPASVWPSELTGGLLLLRSGCNFQHKSQLVRNRSICPGVSNNRDVLQNENCNFRKGPGTRCEKNGACSRLSTRKFVWTASFANKFFVSRSDFREGNPVVQLVQNGGLVGSFRSTGFASIFFPLRFGLRWCSVDRRLDFGEWHAGWLFEPGAAVDRRPSIQFELAMDLILCLRVGRAAHQLFFVDVAVSMREQSEKREVRKSSTTTEQETTPRSWSQTVQATRLGCQTDRSKLHTPPAARAMINSPIEQKLQFSVCKTTRRFAGPSLLSCVLKPSFTKICIQISLCKTSLIIHQSTLSSSLRRRFTSSKCSHRSPGTSIALF